MNYTESLAYLAGLGDELRGVKFDLEAIKRMVAALGHPELKYPSAIVAGTNGKGSTSAILANILQRAGYRTGLYTSPHLIRVNERIRVNSGEISDEDFARSFTEVRLAVDVLLECGELPHRPSFFEFLTATGFLHFARAGAEFAVLEVGMGGRLDATNIVEPRVAIITNVDQDHMEFLGRTQAQIAREKAGIIKTGRPVVSGCEHADAAEVVWRRCNEVGAELIEIPHLARPFNLRNQDGQYVFDLALNGDRFANLRSPLRGRFQVKNALLAVAAALQLKRDGFRISQEAIQDGLGSAFWPGRLEVIHARPLVLLDGAHNPAAAREIADFLKEQMSSRHVRLVYASMRDKAIGEISELLFPLAEEVYLTRPEHARAAWPEEILATARHLPAKVVAEPDPARALAKACKACSPGDVVLATGSLFLVGAIKQALQEGKLALD